MSTSTASGIPKASHIRTKRDAFSAEMASRQPPSRSGLFAITPTVPPPSRPSVVTTFGAHLGNSSIPGASSSRPTTGWTS